MENHCSRISLKCLSPWRPHAYVPPARHTPLTWEAASAIGAQALCMAPLGLLFVRIWPLLPPRTSPSVALILAFHTPATRACFPSSEQAKPQTSPRYLLHPNSDRPSMNTLFKEGAPSCSPSHPFNSHHRSCCNQIQSPLRM